MCGLTPGVKTLYHLQMKPTLHYRPVKRFFCQAFTLVEVVVSVVIVGSLSAGGVVIYQSSVDKTNAASAEFSAVSVSREIGSLSVFDPAVALQDLFDTAAADGDFVDLRVSLVDASGFELDVAGDLSRDVSWEDAFFSGAQVRVCNAAGWHADVSPPFLDESTLDLEQLWSVSKGVKGCDAPLVRSVAAPTETLSVAATPTDDGVSVDVSGLAPDGLVSKVEYSVDGGASWSHVGTASSFVIYGLPGASNVSILVRSFDTSGARYLSVPVSVTTFPDSWQPTSRASSAITTGAGGIGFATDVRLSGDGRFYVTGTNNTVNGLHGAYVVGLNAASGLWEQVGSRIPVPRWSNKNLDISDDGRRVVAASHEARSFAVFEFDDRIQDWVQVGATVPCTAVIAAPDPVALCAATSDFGNRVRISDDGNRVVLLSEHRISVAEFNSVSGDFELTAAINLPPGLFVGNMGLTISADASVIVVASLDASYGVTTYVRSSDGSYKISGSPLPSPAARRQPALDLNGEQVSLSDAGHRLLVGSYNLGAQVYERIGDSWVPLGSFVDGLAPGVENRTTIGYTVALAGDGETFVLAAPNGISSNAAFLGGFALVYEWRVGYWALVLDDIGTADVSLASSYGERVAISDNGRRVLVARDGNGFNPNAAEGYGSVVVFDRS